MTKPLLLLNLTDGYMHVCCIILYILKTLLIEKKTETEKERSRWILSDILMISSGLPNSSIFKLLSSFLPCFHCVKDVALLLHVITFKKSPKPNFSCLALLNPTTMRDGRICLFQIPEVPQSWAGGLASL